MKGAGAESWKYTNLAPAHSVAWEAPDRGAPAIPPAPHPVCGRLVFHNGFFVENACILPKGIRFTQDIHRPIPTEKDAPDSFIADMNAAHRQDSLTLTVSAGTGAPDPLEIVFLAQGEVPLRLAPHLSIVCESGASLALVERHEGAGPTFSAICIFLDLRAGARVDHVRIQGAADTAYLLETTHINIDSGASYTGFYYTDGARLSRHQVCATLGGPQAQAQIGAVALLRATQTGDLTTTIRHAGPGARSTQSVRTVVGGRARGIYQGRIEVAPGADGTDARQQSRALLLSEGAEMDTKPELDILADDVKCTHGAATGSLDAGALFYLRSRGIPEIQARGLLIEGFVSALLDESPEQAAHAEIRARMERWLGAGKETGS